MDYVFLGPPGCGKGTQAQIISKLKLLKHLSAGELLRFEIAQKSSIGSCIENLYNKGEMVSDSLISHLIGKNLIDEKVDGFIYDGYPRSIRQAEDLDLMLNVLGRSVCSVIWFEISNEKLNDRINGRFICKSCKYVYHDEYYPPIKKGECNVCSGTVFTRRLDDDSQILQNRLRLFYEKTYPIIDYYKNQDKLISIQGDSDLSIVTNQIVALIQ